MPNKDQRTIGIHPKVKLPTTALALIGVAVIIVGFVIGDDTLKQEGIAIAGAGGAGGVLGFLAPLGVTTGAGEPDPTATVPEVTQAEALALPEA